MSNFLEFKSQIRRELEEDSPATWADESIVYWVNEATTKLAMKTDEYVRGDFYRDSVPDQQSYDLPDYVLQVHALYYASRPLTRWTFDQWSRMPTLATKGTPTHYTLAARAIWLTPIPTAPAEMRLFITRIPDPISGVNSTQQMPFESRYDDAISAYVKMRAYEQTDQYQRAQYYRDRWQEALADAMTQSTLERIADARTDVVDVEGW